jgi:hypothetical protein
MGSLRFFLSAGGWILIIYQGVNWLRYGHWKKISLLFPIDRFGPSELTAWLRNLGSLPGFHGVVVSVLDAIDLSIFMIFAGWVLTPRARWIEIKNQVLGCLPSSLGNAFSPKSGEETAAPPPNVPSTGGVPDQDGGQRKNRTRYWGMRR